jgi:hypothetical protein
MSFSRSRPLGLGRIESAHGRRALAQTIGAKGAGNCRGNQPKLVR